MDEQIQVEVSDDSILAHKQVKLRSVQQMKQKHLRLLQKVMRLGSRIDAANVSPDQVFEVMEALSGALAGLLIGWSESDIDELTLEEMLLIYNQLGDTTRRALPNGTSSNSTPRSGQTTPRRGRPGLTRSSLRKNGAVGPA
jgi:hypothetical protein